MLIFIFIFKLVVLQCRKFKKLWWNPNKQTPLNKALSKSQLFSKCKKPIWYSIPYYWNWWPSCLTHRVFFKKIYTEKLANILPQKNQNYSNVTRKTSIFFCEKKQKNVCGKNISLWVVNSSRVFFFWGGGGSLATW